MTFGFDFVQVNLAEAEGLGLSLRSDCRDWGQCYKMF